MTQSKKLTKSLIRLKKLNEKFYSIEEEINKITSDYAEHLILILTKKFPNHTIKRDTHNYEGFEIFIMITGPKLNTEDYDYLAEVSDFGFINYGITNIHICNEEKKI